MSRIIMSEAEKIVPVARSTFRKHAKARKFSVSKNARGLQEVDVAELERYYGNLKPLPNQNGNGTVETQETAPVDDNGQLDTPQIEQNGQSETPVDPSEIVALLREQLADTKAELADAKARETKLLSMLETEQEKTKLLMLAPPADENKKRKRSFWDNFRLT